MHWDHAYVIIELYKCNEEVKQTLNMTHECAQSDQID